MYEAPDRYKRLTSARLPGGESAGVAAREADSESSPLRDVQLISRAQLAPFFAAANIVAALILVAAMWGVVSSEWLLPWAAGVAAVNFGLMQLARHQSITCVGRSGHGVPLWQLVGEVVVRAVSFLAVPLFFFPTLDPGTQVITASVMAGLAAGGLGLVVVPQSALAWMIAFTGGVGGALLLGRHSVPFQHMLSILFTLGVSITGVLTVARWAFRQLQANADFGSQSEGAALLLQEYEQRGVGWLWAVDAENRVTYISLRMSTMLGKPANQLLGHSLPALLGGHADLGKVLLEKQPFNGLEMELHTGRGVRWISMTGDPIIDTAGRFEGFRGVGSDITEIRQTQERLTHLANVDVLSGLPNRGRVRQLLGEALRGATSGNVPCAIMFLDLDGLKPVNDTFGHPKGDAVLRAVAKRLVDEVGADGTVGRMGGDEFAIVVNDAQSRKKVEKLADRVIVSIKEPYVIDQTEIRIGVSIGCAFGPIDGATVDDLILKADLALYQAKDAGRGCARYFSSQLQSEQEDRVRLEGDLRQALGSKQFHLVYQPLINAKTQKLVGFEALIRKLKIDGSFVREAGTRPENVAIIQSIVQLAKSFRMSITAEGVETAEDFERMRELGCDTIQGYLFGRPLAYERANQMVVGLGAKRMAG